AAALAAFEHAELPFDRLVDELRVPRDPARNPVFQAMLALQTARMDTLRLPGAEVEPLLGDVRTARFDLTVDGYEQPDGSVRLLVDYPTAVYDQPSIERILAHWTRLLGDGIDSPDLPLRALPGADAEETERVVHALNRTAAPYERDAAVHGLFQAWAARTPDAPALEYGSTRLTYAELDARANRLAARLRAAGAGLETRVGVAMRGCAELPLSLLAVLKAGGAYVPLDPAYPPDRLAFMCADANVSSLLVAGEVPAALSTFTGPVLSVSIEDEMGKGGDDFAPAEVPAEALAYVVYTSGSTGTPKGIGLPHRGVVRLVRSCAYAPFAADERVAQLSNPSFDALTFEVWGALLNGAALVGIDRETTLSPRALATAMREKRITTALLPTALFNLAARLAPDGFGTLRHLLFGGEAVATEAVRAVRTAAGPERLVNAYGPAEGTTMATWHLVGEVAGDTPSIPIGLPLPNSTAYVVDAEGRPCNLGEPGELWIGGDGLGRGYLGRPALTAERFVPDPFSGAGGARLYRTGDRVRRLESGALEFLGRLDAQVKVRGFRVEPGEVEAAIRALPGVRDCVVAVRGRDDEARLVAWVVSTHGASLEPAELRDALSRRLPPYLVPSSLRVIGAIPLTANGKVDRAALPEAGDGGTAHVPPSSGTETALAEVWRELLGGGPVGARDDFFERGGHSLMATRLVTAVRQALGIELPVREVFQATRLDRMAARIDALRGTAGVDGDGHVVIRPHPRPEGIATASSAQRRLWVIDRLRPGTPVYNVPVPLRLRGELDVLALEAALNGLRARHESLRTTFAERDGEPVQVIHPFEPESLRIVDLSALGYPDLETEARRLADGDANAGFDLRRGPLMRATLVRLDEDDHFLLWCFHHIVTDGASLDVLRHELATLYAAARRGSPSPLTAQALQYADYAEWERSYLTAEWSAEAEEFWRAKLTDAPPALEIPTDHPRPAEQSHRGARTPSVHLPAEVVAPLRELARREGTTLLAVLLAAARVVLARASGQADVVIGTPATGRTRPELEGVAGFFTNLLPLRLTLAGDPGFRALLRAERDALLGALANQELPFERIVEALRLPRDASRHPVFQATLGLVSGDGWRWEMEGVRVEPFPVEYRQVKADLDFDVVESAGGVELAAYYAADLFAPASAQRLVVHLARVLRAAVKAPDQPLSTLTLVDPEELNRTDAWGRAEPGDASGTLYALLADAAQRAPHAPAVVWEEGSLTYAELEAHASVVSRHLRALGAGPETLVGMVLQPSPEAVAAVLGILRCGAAYLPIDPYTPDLRVAETLTDAGAIAIIGRASDAARISGLPLIAIDSPGWFFDQEADDAPPARVDPASLAYVIYTSGSTGRPKGVAVPHGPAALHARAAARAYGLAPNDRCVLFASLAFDQSVDVLFPAFVAGASVVPRGAAIWSPAETVEKVRRLDVTVMEMPTAYWAQLVREPEVAAQLKTRLRRVIAGGEEMRVDAVEGWERAPGACVLINAYGPTETVVTSACFVVPDSFSA
ncbi:MAG TPA: amino acid adenylation domain-containing protein, partial [Longimicrobium sp.]|nr:amino acid adenylation domain-containing protein [Longimicrobium sp.]